MRLLRGYGSGIAVSCGVGSRCGSDLALLWLWYRPLAIAPIIPLAWEPPYAMGAALEKMVVGKLNITGKTMKLDPYFTLLPKIKTNVKPEITKF